MWNTIEKRKPSGRGSLILPSLGIELCITKAFQGRERGGHWANGATRNCDLLPNGINPNYLSAPHERNSFLEYCSLVDFGNEEVCRDVLTMKEFRPNQLRVNGA